MRGTAALDLVLIVVVYLSLTSGPVTGVVAGSVAGLIQDALSSGVIGIGGLAKTLVGFAAGRVGTQFIVTAPLPRFVVFIGATVLHAAIFMGLYVLLGLRQFSAPYADVAGSGGRQRLPRRGGLPDDRVAARLPGAPGAWGDRCRR